MWTTSGNGPQSGSDGRCGLTLCEQAVHHSLYELELVLERVVDKVGIDEHAVRRAEGRVVRQEERRRRLRTAVGSEGQRVSY